jgi:CheY-like chemotaxis protein
MRRDVLALVVDDSEINLIVTQEMLRALSVETDLAGGGAAALEMCKARRYDIILMDYLMPDMDGIEAAKLVRTVTDAPIVAMTADDSPDAQELFLANGFTAYLSKPATPEALAALFERLLPSRKPHTGPTPNARTGEVLFQNGTARAEEHTAVTLPDIAAAAGLDMRKAIARLDGCETTYISVVKLFARTGLEKLKLLEGHMTSSNWKAFLVIIHGQKSALANIGAAALSEEARIMESAVKDEKYELIEAVFSGFASRCSALCGKLHSLWPEEGAVMRDVTEQDRARLPETLLQINRHLDQLEQDEALDALAPLLAIRFDEPLGPGLTTLRNAIAAYDYDEAAQQIGRLMKGAT